MKKLLIAFLPLLLSLPLLGQTQTYRQSVVNGQTLIYRIDFNQKAVQVQHMPADATRAKIGIQRLNLYIREAKATFNIAQFGSNKYFDPNYFFSVDFNTNQDNVATRQAQGVSMFSRFIQPNGAEYNNLPGSKKFYYQTENELHAAFEGAKYYESTLAQIEAQLYAAIPWGVGYWVANIETSNEWHQWQYVNGPYNHGYDSWNAAKSRKIISERNGQEITLEALWNSGQWDEEMTVRRNNRLAVMMTIAKQRNTWVAYGSSMWQAEPRTNSLQTTNLFKEGSANVSAIGGDGNGNITLNGRSYTGLNKNVYAYESSMLDYFYYFGWEGMSLQDYQDIWINKLPGTQTMPYVWSRMPTFHIVASEKGHWQANKHRMQTIAGQTNRGSVRMQEPNFEGAFYTTDWASHNSFVPFQELQNIDLGGGNIQTPKIWLPPYYVYSAYAVHRFLEGSTPGSGYHLWHTPGICLFPPTHPFINHHMHTVSALFQARNDLQPLERFYAGSTLVQDPEVQINQTGSWSSYSGCDAFAFSPSGGRGTQLPVYIVRYKQTTSGWQVYVLGGMNQGWSDTRTDLVRLPGALNGNMMRVKLTGPAAQVFEFSISSSDSNQTYDATNYTFTTQAGYAGRLSSN